ncbi:MAG: hypoxanthine phosphoribosyltransferase [Candidatus Electryoneaceae bacterium]|nr:hypoxanthine phosphoribosyltransferase [Candidatus Electryoneaceae bacterium]
MESKLLTPLITEIEIRLRIAQLAKQIAEDYAGTDLIVISIMKGSFMFAADLLRRLYDLGAQPEADFIRAASYGYRSHSSGRVEIGLDIDIPVEGRDVLLLDDISDTGRTMTHLLDHFSNKKTVGNIRTCVLLDKPSRREVEFVPDYVGFEIPDLFIVGYGTDYNERYRSLPFIAVVKTDE